MKTVCLVKLKPNGAQEMYRLLNWGRTRGVPDGEGRLVKPIFSEGMVCEIDEEDLTEAAEFCSVSVLEKKQVTP